MRIDTIIKILKAIPRKEININKLNKILKVNYQVLTMNINKLESYGLVEVYPTNREHLIKITEKGVKLLELWI